MINSVSADSFESLVLTNSTPRSISSSEIRINNTIDSNDVVIYRNNNSIFKDYFCIIVLLATLSIICFILIKQQNN